MFEQQPVGRKTRRDFKARPLETHRTVVRNKFWLRLFTRRPSCGHIPSSSVCQIPSEYGGDSPQALGESTDEKALRRLAASLGPTSLPPPPPEGAARSRSDVGASQRSGDGSAAGGVANGDGDDGDHLVPDYSGGVGHESGVMEEGGVPGEFVGGGGRGGGSSHGPPDGEGSSTLQAALRPRESSAVSAAAFGGASRDAKGASSGPGSGGDGDGGERGPTADGGGGGSAGGLGVTQRFASAVRRMRGGATRAYLGVENKFRYDTARRMWVMEGEGRGRSGATGNDGSGGVGERTGRKDTGGVQVSVASASRMVIVACVFVCA